MSSETPSHPYKIKFVGMCKRPHCDRLAPFKVYTGKPLNRLDGEYCDNHAEERLDELYKERGWRR